MAAYAALLSLINNIDQIMKHPRLSTSLDNKHIHPLLEKAGFLLDFMEANNYGAGSKEAEDLESEIASAAHAAEDVIESHIVDQIDAGTSEISLRCSLDLQQKTQDMDAVLKKANELKGKHGSGEEQHTHAAPVLEIGDTTAMVGLDEELKHLVLELTGDQSSRHTISIVGMGGTGKTTLAKNIFQHPRIKEHFHCRAWATLSQQHNAQDILSQLLSSLRKSSSGAVEIGAYAALVSLINTIGRLSTSLDNEQIQPLLEKAGFLLAYMEANNYGRGIKEAEDLERDIASAAHAAEDVIESHIVDQIHAGATEIRFIPKIMKICLNLCESISPLNLQQKIQDMDAVLKKANELKGKQGSGEEQHTHAAPVLEFGDTTTMVGLDDELKHLVQELTGHQSSRQTISIVGMGGTGKTTLAKNIFQHPFIKEHFHCRAWATISQQHNAQEILSQLLSSLGKSGSDVGKKLYQTLTGQRYLIILDDIWSVDAWNEVKRFFPDDNNGSRVVLTSRLSNVANDCGSSSPFDMKFLDEAKSWELFCEKAFQNEPCPRELREVGEEIVKLCKGLALSIVVMGGLLSKSPSTVEYWKGVVRDLKSVSDSKEKQESLDILTLSYTHLPPHLKPCFLYMGTFKEDSEIHVSNVVQLWVAEGFIKPNGSGVLEENAEGYLKELIDRNLILVGRRRKNGKIRCCGIHDLLRDLCLKVSNQQHFLHVCGWSKDIRGSERRLVCGYVEPNASESPLTRSIIIDNSSVKPVKYRLVRIWGHDTCIDYSAAEFYENVNLRYLACKQPYDGSLLCELPPSVSLIWNLQTLIIRSDHVSLIVVAPTTIWKMPQLKHVKCGNIYLPWRDGEDELLKLDNLQTLKTTLNLRLSEEVCKTIPNINKLYLLYHEELHGYDDGLIEHLCNLDQLHKLESLNLSITHSTWPSPYTGLNKILRFPSSLKKLSLCYCGLEWEDLTVIGSLPQLQVLLLEWYSFRGREWSPVTEQFRHLKFLKINANDLEKWNAERSNFPVLEKLVLVNCFSLKEIPSDIGEIPTLQLIRVNNCNVEAVISAVKIKEDQVENLGNDGALEVQVRMLDKYVPNLKAMVSINNIQLEIV